MTPVLAERQGEILVVTLNRPERRNAVTLEVSERVAQAMDEFDADPALRCAIITGAGGHFSSGMDLKAFVDGARPELDGRGFSGVTEAPPAKPLIAAVEGWALAGGLELVLACDLIVASDTAVFGLPEPTRGLVAGSGGLIRLARRIPSNIAMEYGLTGAQMDAATAQRLGLLNRLVPAGQALGAALELARTVAANAPLSVATSKRIMVEQASWPADRLWDIQRPLVDAVVGSRDAQEGARAFAEKRQPVWEGR
jgi:enoyl-CoA hydratase